jgi:signal transduction histidine kinase
VLVPLPLAGNLSIQTAAEKVQTLSTIAPIRLVVNVADEEDFEHALKNYIAIILGYADLLLEDLAADDPRLPDIREIHKAATAAVALLNSRSSST